MNTKPTRRFRHHHAGTERRIDKPFLLRFGVLPTTFRTRQNLDTLVRHDVCHSFASALSRDHPNIGKTIRTRKAASAVGIRCSERRGITIANLERSIVEFLSSVTVHPDFARWARQELQIQHDRETVQSEAVRDSMGAELKKLRKQRDNLTTCLIQDLIDQEEFERRRRDLDLKIATMTKRLEESDEQERKWLELVRRTIDFAEGAKSRFIAGDMAMKKKIFLALGPKVHLRNGRLVIEPHPWFVPLQNSQNLHAGNIGIEPSENES